MSKKYISLQINGRRKGKYLKPICFNTVDSINHQQTQAYKPILQNMWRLLKYTMEKQDQTRVCNSVKQESYHCTILVSDNMILLLHELKRAVQEAIQSNCNHFSDFVFKFPFPYLSTKRVGHQLRQIVASSQSFLSITQI